MSILKRCAANKAVRKYSSDRTPTVVYGGKDHPASTALFKALLDNWSQESFVRVKDYDGIMDVVCLLPCGKVFVEMQVAPEDFFDKRYAANVFSNQLKDVKKVISVSILGGRRDKEYVWGQEFMRCYKLEEQSSHKILDEGIEILSIMNFQKI